MAATEVEDAVAVETTGDLADEKGMKKEAIVVLAPVATIIADAHVLQKMTATTDPVGEVHDEMTVNASGSEIATTETKSENAPPVHRQEDRFEKKLLSHSLPRMNAIGEQSLFNSLQHDCVLKSSSNSLKK